jgi:hypothetical protein
MTILNPRDFNFAENEFSIQVPLDFAAGTPGETQPVVIAEKCRCRAAIMNITTTFSVATVIQLFKNGSVTAPVLSFTIPVDSGPTGGGPDEDAVYIDFELDVDQAGGEVRFDVGDVITLSSDGAAAAVTANVMFIMRKD